MVVKVYVSGISGNKEVKKRQQRVLMILDSKTIKYDVIDITEPGKEADKDFMQNNSKSNGGTVSDPNPRSPLPPQLFNDEEYCGDYDQFDLANEVDTLEQFLKMEVPPEEPAQSEIVQDKAINGDDVGETNKESELAGDQNGSADSTESPDEPSSEPVAADKGSTAVEDTESKQESNAASKEGTPSKDQAVDAGGDAKEKSPEKEAERQKSAEKEGSPETKAQSPDKEIKASITETESAPEEKVVNENGSQSSREQSQEKTAPPDLTEVERTKDNHSAALIQSEQVAAAE